MQETPRPWGGLIPAFVAGQMTEGTASRAILLRPSSTARLAERRNRNTQGQMPGLLPEVGTPASPAADPLDWAAFANATAAV